MAHELEVGVVFPSFSQNGAETVQDSPPPFQPKQGPEAVEEAVVNFSAHTVDNGDFVLPPDTVRPNILENCRLTGASAA